MNNDNKKISDEDKFKELNREYQVCLNQYYDKFFDNKQVELENVCLDIKEKMMKTGDLYAKMMGELDSYKKNDPEKDKK